MDEALAQTRIVGLATNVQFLRHVVRSPSFAKAQLDTALDLHARTGRALQARTAWACRLAAAAAVAQTLLQEQALAVGRPIGPPRRLALTWHDRSVRFAFEFHGEPATAQS
jgi:3-methylcrotonyl-CoA carboxylase alpha subunit